jgi:hypothetical protein
VQQRWQCLDLRMPGQERRHRVQVSQLLRHRPLRMMLLLQQQAQWSAQAQQRGQCRGLLTHWQQGQLRGLRYRNQMPQQLRQRRVRAQRRWQLRALGWQPRVQWSLQRISRGCLWWVTVLG